MALALTVVYCIFFLISLSSGEDKYNVNKLLDGSLKELADKLTASGDITVRLDNVTLGDYTLIGGRLADFTSLRRVGDSWMYNDLQTVVVNGSLSLDTMFLAHAKIDGPRNIPDPLVTVSKNSMEFVIRITLDTKASCKATHEFKWKTIDGVTLYSDNPSMNNIDLSSWVKSNVDSLNEQLVPPITRLFDHNIHMCESKRLNLLEMIKYNIDAERFLEQNTKNLRYITVKAN